MAVWMIAWANLRRKKGVALSMGFLIALSVALLNMGTALLTGIGTFYNQANKDLNGPDYVVRFAANEYKDEYLDYFLADSRVTSAQTNQVILMDTATLPEGGALSATFFSLDDNKGITGYEYQKLADVPESQSVYLPEYFKELGYAPGDTFTLNCQKQSYTFYIAGYSQSTWLHSSVTSLVNFYLPAESFEALYNQVGGGYMLLTQVHDLSDLTSLRQDFRSQTDVKIESAALDALVLDFTLDEMRTGSTMVVSIFSAILLAFSILIVLVCMLVIRFRISNHIETHMHNIGALGAIGYTGKQICQSIAMEFFILGAAGTFTGVLLSYGFTGALGSFITHSVGVKWQSGLHLTADIVSVLLVIGVLCLVSQLSARKAARILPVLALRGGIHSHSFTKNHFPLDRTNLGLTAALGFKHICFQVKTHIMIGVIFIGVTFALLSSVVLFLNLGIDQSLMVDMSGYEISDVLVYKTAHADYDELADELQSMDGVRKVSLFETTSISLGDDLVTGYVSDDYSLLETVTVYEGSLPVYDNEIVLTGILAKSLGKHIGDTVEVGINGVSADFIICGLAQTMSNLGRQCYLTLDGVIRLNPVYQRNTFQVYLDPGLAIPDFIENLEKEFRVLSSTADPNPEDPYDAARRTAEEKLTRLLSIYGVDSAQFALMKDGEIILSGDTSAYQIDHVENNQNLFASNINSISSATGIVAFTILIGTLLIVALVFYMIIKSMLVRRSREFGIYKASGYTNRQLMEQIAVGFMPSVIIGSGLGLLTTCAFVSPLCSLLFQGVGISRMNLVLHPEVLIPVSILLIAFSFVICMLMAWKIKKITVYTLLTE